MALPALEDLKNYLRIETTAEDEALEGIRDRAEALVRHLLDRPIEAETRTYRIERDNCPPLDRLLFPQPPLTAASVVITDKDGDEVDVADYRVDAETGVIRGENCNRFCAFPYDIEAENGLALRDDYEVVAEPMLSEAILAYATMLYHQRNPNASQESTAGVTVIYQGMAMPQRTAEVIRALRRTV